MHELSVVFPCLNESGTIGECVKRALNMLRENGISGEVVVADNGSLDGSEKIAGREGARIIHESRKGYGYALNAGIKASTGQYIVHLDSDLSYPVEEIPSFLEALHKGYDLVMGSRMNSAMEPGAMPFLHQRIGTPFLTCTANIFFGCGISDINCGMRGLSRKSFESLELGSGGMEYASEMVLKAAIKKMRITQIPISFRKDGRKGPSHLSSFRDGFRHLQLQCRLAVSERLLNLWS